MDTSRAAKKLAARVAAAQAAASVNDKWREDAGQPEGGDGTGKQEASSSTSAGQQGTSTSGRRHGPVVAPCLQPLVRTKLTPCPTALIGACTFGFQCPFAHSLEEVYVARRPFRRRIEARSRKHASPGAAPASVGSEYSGSSSGKSRGSRAKEPKKKLKSMAASASKEAGDDAEESLDPVPTLYHKTRLCYNFLEGKCQKTDGCTFAHSQQELQRPGEARQVAQDKLSKQYAKNMTREPQAPWWPPTFGRPPPWFV